MSQICPPVVDAAVRYRDRVRTYALRKDDDRKQLARNVLNVSDEFRADLKEAGVVVRDGAGETEKRWSLEIKE
tara:strand:+ start:120 stop:338 length:219 start_codon:yes stop_codon:yes gene_type:complete